MGKRSNMARHVKDKHDKIVDKCDHGGKAFSRKHYLKGHIRTDHPAHDSNVSTCNDFHLT